MAEKNDKISTGSGPQNLVIVESPGKIKTITKFLGSNYKIVSTSGHVKDLPEKSIGVEIKDGHVAIDYVPVKGKGVVIADICKEAKKSTNVFLASDPDREGEIISYHMGEEIKKATKNKVNIFRIVFNEITKPAVQAAIEQKHDIDLQKVAAQQARRILDRWVGYEISPILWRKIAKGLSAGRVQSVAVLFICKREAEIAAFVPEESWSVTAQLGYKKIFFEVQLYKIKGKAAVLKNEAAAQKVLEAVKGKAFIVQEIVDKERLKNPIAPFITSSLQQDAYNKLGFSVDKTMTIAQRLYEGVALENNSQEALITYMRTDSTRLSDTALTETRDFISNSFGGNYLPKKPIIYAEGGAQDAHEAIRPISVGRTPESVKRLLEPDFFKLYELVWRRAVACQMTPAKYAQRQVLVVAGEDYLFKATGSTLLFDGFLKVYRPEEEAEEKVAILPEEIKGGDNVALEKLSSKQHFTQPPPRYTEATLVKELKTQGIGRPSTYATIMTTIPRRKYVGKENKRFVPTELGKAVVKMLVENLPDIINVTFTATMEDDLDKIALGEKERDVVLLGFYKKFKQDLENFWNQPGGERPAKYVDTGLQCPRCTKNKLVIRLARTGEFLACLGFPECNYTSSFERNDENQITIVEKAQPKELAVACPNCGKNLVEKMGRFGKFAACPGYPDCKYICKNPKKAVS